MFLHPPNVHPTPTETRDPMSLHPPNVRPTPTGTRDPMTVLLPAMRIDLKISIDMRTITGLDMERLLKIFLYLRYGRLFNKQPTRFFSILVIIDNMIYTYLVNVSNFVINHTIYLSISLFIYPSIYLSIYLSIQRVEQQHVYKPYEQSPVEQIREFEIPRHRLTFEDDSLPKVNISYKSLQ